MLTNSLSTRLQLLNEGISAACARSGRRPSDITLVAVSKTVDRPVVDEAYALGVRHFGENRVQQATATFAADLPADVKLHMIGQLQTNKVRIAVELFDLIESVDRTGLIEALNREAGRQGATVPILLQVNVAREAQKGGCDPDDAAALVGFIVGQQHLELRGLMTIAPLVDDPEAVRPLFRRLRALRDELSARHPGLELPVLSMGMTNDFQIAIEEGATHIRVGRALFGS